MKDAVVCRWTGPIALAVYLACYVIGLFALSRESGRPLSEAMIEPLLVLALFGLAFPLVALALTRNSRVPISLPAAPKGELAALLIYSGVLAIGVLGYGLSAIREAVPAQPHQELAVLVLKLITFVAIPVALLAKFGNPWRDTLSPRWSWARHGRALVGMGLLLLVFQALVGSGLKTLTALHPSLITLVWAVPLCFFWLVLEVGLCEEVLFRRVLQTRFSAILKSELAAVCAVSLLFGLAHAPGLYLRGAAVMEGANAHPSLLWSVAYSVVIISPTGFLFGALWARTRSLALLVVLHALGDLLPGLAGFIENWT